MTPFTQYKPWMTARYGAPLFRVPVQLATSCPHGRCAFCSENGAKAQQTQQHESPIAQIDAAIRFSKRRYKAQKLMLYIQAFTTDLTDPIRQQQILDALEHVEFEAISIGTRPDCLPPAALDFLESLKTPTKNRQQAGPARREVWIELGVQTTNDRTLRLIERGHDWACSKQAILNLAKRDILVAPHVIIGLPEETTADWNHTAEQLAELPISAIKIHNLHILKGTGFATTRPETLTHWEYAEALIAFLRRIPRAIPIMRISTDTPDAQLIAPHWPLEKGQFLDYLVQQMTMRQIRQGDRYEPVVPNAPPIHEPVKTADGSITFFSEDWKEHYHTKTGARLEAKKKFVDPSGLQHLLGTTDLKLLDVCFGLGHNSLAAITAAAQTGHRLQITALEMDKRIVRAAAQNIQPTPDDPVNWPSFLNGLLRYSTVHIPPASTSIRWGDARWLIQNLADDSFDIVFHDPFSSQHCPELWTVDFFKQLARVMTPNGLLLTYSSSQPVRGALLEAGFFIGETHPGHQMGDGTIASPSALPACVRPIKPLDMQRAIAYRDPYLCATSKTILRNRQEALESMRRRSS